MQKIINFIKKNVHLFILLFISFASHWYIFFDFKILNQGDWLYIPRELLKKLLFYSQWNSHFNLGGVIGLSPNMVFFWVASFLANVFSFFSWDIFTRIFFLVPIVFLTPLFSFLLFKKIFKNGLISFFSSCLYCFNTIFLKIQLDFLTYGFIWWVLPALFLSVLNYLETQKNKYLVFNALLVFIGIAYEIRIMILVLIFLLLFQVIYLIINNNQLLKKIKDNSIIVISYGVGILMHSFWLIPMMVGLSSDIMAQVASGIFASYFDILDAFTLHMYSWSHNLAMEPFFRQPIELRYFLIPIIAIIGIIVFKKLFKNGKHNLYFIFFGISLLIFVFLGKQELAPFGEFYTWAFHNIPLFNLYRESLKFFILIALSLSFFFGIGLFYIYKTIKKHNAKIALFTVMIILFFSSIFNLEHFFTQKIGGMTKGVEIPNDYKILEEKLSNDNEYYRILWLPINHRFGFYSETRPFLNMTNLVIASKDKVGFTLFDGSSNVSDQLLFLLKQQYSDRLLDNASVKYVIVPISDKREVRKNMDSSKWVYEIFEHFGPRYFFVNELNKIDYLEKIDIGTKDLMVYENKNYLPHIYSDSNLDYIHGGFIDLGNFSQNQNLYLNSGIEKNEYLLDNLGNIIIPVEADPDKIEEMKLAITEAKEPKEKKKLQSDLNLYTNHSFLKDFRLEIPVKSTYKIYIKKNSVLANNKNIGVEIAGHLLEKDEAGIDKEGWSYFNQIELSTGEYSFKIYVGNELINYINSGDVILSAKDLTEPIKTPQLEYKQIYPTKYIVNVSGASESFPLFFSESFHPDWKIYVQPELVGQGTGKFISENNQGTIQNENLNSGHFYDVFLRKPVLKDKHFIANSFANAWWVDIEELEEQGIIKKNEDGGYDFSIIIEFEPQKYFYLGLGISGVTFLGCIGYLVYDWRKRKISNLI